MNRNDLLTQLIGLLPAQFDEVLLRAQIPVHYLSAGGAQTTRATEAIRYAEQQGNFDQFARVVTAVVATARPVGQPNAVAAAAPPPVNRPARDGALLAVGAVTGAFALGLLLLLLRDAQTLASLGVTRHVWYVLLLPLGLSAAIAVFSLSRSYARYIGKTLGGAFEIGSPVLIMLLAVVLGFAYAPPPAPPRRLPLIGYIADEHGRPIPQARATMAGVAATTDQDGRFVLMLPADLPEGERAITITAPGYEPWVAQAVPGGNPLRARLTPFPGSP